MPRPIRAVFFDVDGVLINSLPQHLMICHDKASEFGLKLGIPTVNEFRHLVNRGATVSPMRQFFLSVGFPEAYVDQAVADYNREFSQRYRPPAFDGVDSMLQALRRNGLRLGLVTSNTRSNVVPALERSIDMFEESCLFFYDTHEAPRSKPSCLAEGARLLDVDPPDCVYIGDQPADAQAAATAGFRFLGVTYGWGIIGRSARFETADSVTEIPDKIAQMSSLAHDY